MARDYDRLLDKFINVISKNKKHYDGILLEETDTEIKVLSLFRLSPIIKNEIIDIGLDKDRTIITEKQQIEVDKIKDYLIQNGQLLPQNTDGWFLHKKIKHVFSFSQKRLEIHT